MSREEARSFIGKRVSISERQLAFAPRRCKIAEITVHYVADEWYAMPGLPYFVDIDCTTDMEVPAFLTGKSCNRMVGILDGWTFDMRRAR